LPTDARKAQPFSSRIGSTYRPWPIGLFQVLFSFPTITVRLAPGRPHLNVENDSGPALGSVRASSHIDNPFSKRVGPARLNSPPGLTSPRLDCAFHVTHEWTRTDTVRQVSASAKPHARRAPALGPLFLRREGRARLPTVFCLFSLLMDPENPSRLT